MCFLKLCHNLHQNLFDIYSCRTILLTSATGNALRLPKLFVGPNKFMVVPVKIAFFESGAEVVSAGNGGKARKGAGRPEAAASTDGLI